MSTVPNTHVIAARQLKAGDRLYHPMVSQGVRVQRVTTCNDGSLRVLTMLDEQRMTGSIPMRVLN